MDEIMEGLTPEEAAILEAAVAEAHEGETLPENSASLLIDEHTSRFSSAEWFDKVREQGVMLAGLGGIGSYVAFLLGRMAISSLYLYDDDSVEETNLSGQLYTYSDIGSRKTLATASRLRTYSNFYNVATNGRYNASSNSTNIMICGFDNMEARRTFYMNWKTHTRTASKEDCLFIDGRLAAEEFQVFCIKGTDDYLMKKYEEEWLFDDSAAEETLCSYKQTSFCANMIASVMVNLFVNFIANKCNPLIERELPFYTRYDASRMYFKTE